MISLSEANDREVRMRILFMTCILLVLPDVLSAQQDVCLEELAKGMKALGVRDGEKAAHRLRMARKAAAEMPLGTNRTLLEKRIKKLMHKADFLDVTRNRALTRAAKELIRVAESYIRVNRFATAKELLVLASGLDKQLTKEPLKRAEALLEARNLDSLPAEEKKARCKVDETPLNDIEIGNGAFKGGIQYTGTGKWLSLGKHGLVSPKITDGQSHMIVSRRRISGDVTLELEALIGKGDGIAGFFFGYKDSGKDSVLIEIAQRKNSRWNRAFEVKWGADFKMQELQCKPYSVTPKEKAAWISISIQVKGHKISAVFSTGPSLTLDLSGKDLTGRFGIYISGNWGNRDPVQFRNLEIKIPPSK